jgi:hypothetical protein
MNTDFTSLIKAIETELTGLGYKVAAKPLDEKTNLDDNKMAWIENASGTLMGDYSQKYHDIETIAIIIMEKRNKIGRHNEALMTLADRRNEIRINMTDLDFHNRLPTILHKAVYGGHESTISDTAMMARINFEFTLRRSL